MNSSLSTHQKHKTMRTIAVGAGTAQETPCGCVLPDGRTFCAKPCTHLLTTRSERMSAPAFYPLCEECAYRVRRAEVDLWLSGVGGRVIQVKSLDAALEAGWHGGFIVQRATEAATDDYPGVERVYVHGAVGAAHLARVALGEATV